MDARALLLVAGLALPLLAGCTDPPAPAEPLARSWETGAEGLENGTFYAFPHAGGDLAVAVRGNGSAEVVLYGADDVRLGHVGVGAERARGRFVLEGVEAGELVLHALAINGTLDLRSGGAPVPWFRALTAHYERHVLVSRDASLGGMPVPLPGGGDSVSEDVEVRLLRAPTDVLLYVHASFESLDVRVQGRSGPVLEVSTGSSVPFAGVYSGPMRGEAYPENVRDGELVAHVEASAFEGDVVLEAASYSRARPAEAAATWTGEVPRFTYGDLPDHPVAFDVHRDAVRLYLWQERGEVADGAACEAEGGDADACGPEDAHVALFGPDDRRVATVAVPPDRVVALPVHEPGSWVAVLLGGEATLGADRVPGDFELHPLDVGQQTFPGGAAGSDDGSYEEERSAVRLDGVPYRVHAVELSGTGTGPVLDARPLVLGTCTSGALALLHGGETIGAWGYDSLGSVRAPEQQDPSLLLGDGPLEVAYGDHGPGCDRPGVAFDTYRR